MVAEFFPDEASGAAYQSESDLEKALLTQLQAQAYEYLPITTEADLVANLRAQLGALNGIRFSDTEWRTFFNERIASANSGIVEKAVRIWEDHVQLLTREGRHHQERPTPRQRARPQQPAPGHQPVRDSRRHGRE